MSKDSALSRALARIDELEAKLSNISIAARGVVNAFEPKVQEVAGRRMRNAIGALDLLTAEDTMLSRIAVARNHPRIVRVANVSAYDDDWSDGYPDPSDDDWSDGYPDPSDDEFNEFEDEQTSLRGTSQCDGLCDPQCQWCLVAHDCPNDCAGGHCPYAALAAELHVELDALDGPIVLPNDVRIEVIECNGEK